MLDESMLEQGFIRLPPDPLSPADDAVVGAWMITEPDGFLDAAAASGRRPETGAFARRGSNATAERGVLAARVQARVDDACENLRAMYSSLRPRVP